MDEIDTDTTPWMKASASDGGGGCLEFRRHQRTVQLRDSKLGDLSPVLTYSRREIECFLVGRNNNEFAHLLDGVD